MQLNRCDVNILVLILTNRKHTAAWSENWSIPENLIFILITWVHFLVVLFPNHRIWSGLWKRENCCNWTQSSWCKNLVVRWLTIKRKIDGNDYKINASYKKDLNTKDEERLLGKLMKTSDTFAEVRFLIITLW
jgi:hypothetical protein